MKFARQTWWSAVATVVLAGAVLTAATRAQTPPPPAAAVPAAPATTKLPPTKLAVVNIVELFENLKEKTAADDAIETMKKNFEQESRKKQSDLDLAADNLDKTYKRGTDAYRKAQEDLMRRKAQKDTEDRVNQELLFVELRVRTADLYRKINEAVAAYAQANGIALVFVADNPNVEGVRTQEQLQAMVTVRKVLYADPSFDITKAILTKMNTEFELGSRSKPPATRP
jgi:Skp family chaperone for outer membrane proteins